LRIENYLINLAENNMKNNVIKDSEYIDEKIFTSIYHDCDELIRLLVSIVKTTKQSDGIK